MASAKNFYVICRTFHDCSYEKFYEIVTFQVTANYTRGFKIKDSESLRSVLFALAISNVSLSYDKGHKTYAIGIIQEKEITVEKIKSYVTDYENEAEADKIAPDLYDEAGAVVTKLDLSKF